MISVLKQQPLAVTSRICAVIISCLLHLVSHTTFFIHQSQNVCVETPNVAAFIAYLSLMDLIIHTEFIPEKWAHMPVWARFAVDLMLTIWLGEFALLFCWSHFENICVGLLKSCFRASDRLRACCASCIMLILSGCISWAAGTATNRMAKLNWLKKQLRTHLNSTDGHGELVPRENPRIKELQKLVLR